MNCPHCRIIRQPNECGRSALFSKQQEALIVHMVLQNYAIHETQQRVTEDNVNFDGINSVSLSTIDRVLQCNRQHEASAQGTL